MVCIYCQQPTRVTNSRLNKRSNATWRRRLCINCGSVFSTLEKVDSERSYVVEKKDGTIVPYFRDELFISIYRACGHRPQPIYDASALVATIESELRRSAPKEAPLTSSLIATVALEILQRFDNVAATYYQAYFASSP